MICPRCEEHPLTLAPGEKVSRGPVRFVCVGCGFEVVRRADPDPGAPRP